MLDYRGMTQQGEGFVYWQNANMVREPQAISWPGFKGFSWEGRLICKALQGFCQGFSKILSRICKDCQRFCQGFPRIFSKILSNISKEFFKDFQRFCQRFPKIFSRIFKDFVKDFQRFFQGFSKIFSRIFKDFFKDFQEKIRSPDLKFPVGVFGWVWDRLLLSSFREYLIEKRF